MNFDMRRELGPGKGFSIGLVGIKNAFDRAIGIAFEESKQIYS